MTSFGPIVRAVSLIPRGLYTCCCWLGWHFWHTHQTRENISQTPLHTDSRKHVVQPGDHSKTLWAWNQIKSNLFWVKLLRACSRQCRNNLHIDNTYLQTYTEDNVQNTQTDTQYTQCTVRHTYSYQYTLYSLCTHSTLCTHTHTVICEGATAYT